METGRLLETALRRWWIVAIAFAATTALTLMWVIPKPPMYESSGTYVVQPRSDPGEDSVRALEALIRGGQINATYALIARSDSIQSTAEGRLSSSTATQLQVDAEAMTGTNALSISARARQANAAQALAVAAGVETMAYVEDLGEPYQLVLLDPPELPTHPVNSRKPLTVALGAMLGLILGIGLAAMMDRIAALREARRAQAAAGPAGTDGGRDLVADATSDPRVRWEMLEASCRSTTYSVGVLKLAQRNGHRNGNGNGNGGSARFDDLLRNQDLEDGRTLTYLREGLFAIVLPGMRAVAASKLLSDWLVAAGDLGTAPDDEQAALRVSIAVLECDSSSVNGEMSGAAPGQ